MLPAGLVKPRPSPTGGGWSATALRAIRRAVHRGRITNAQWRPRGSEILLEEFLKPLALSQYQLAKEIGVPARRINEIVHGQRRISADTALRLARFFGTSERFWINLQSRYDMEIERDRLGDAFDGIRPLTAAS